MNETVEIIKSRRSIRKYKPQCPKKEELEVVISAGVCAPSGRNLQSAIIVAVTNPDDVKTLSRLNAQVRGQENPYYGAPAVLLVLAETQSEYKIQDGSLVMGNLMNAAHAIGLGTCWINRLNEVFELPEGKALLRKWGIKGEYTGIASCVIGYPDEEPKMKMRKENYVYFVE